MLGRVTPAGRARPNLHLDAIGGAPTRHI
jgi:hypothetical protein